MTPQQAVQLIATNAMYIDLMEENIREGVMIEESRDCVDALRAQIVEARRMLVSKIMNIKSQKFTTDQLKEALIILRERADQEGTTAFEMTFDEVARRMGDEAFDAWCEAQKW